MNMHLDPWFYFQFVPLSMMGSSSGFPVLYVVFFPLGFFPPLSLFDFDFSFDFNVYIFLCAAIFQVLDIISLVNPTIVVHNICL